MKRFRTSTVGAAGLAVLMLLPAAGFAAGEHHGAPDAATVERGADGNRLTHMGGGMAGKPGMVAPAQGYRAGPGQGYGMGPGMMGQGVPGQGYGMGPGMMAPGYGYAPQPGYGMGPGAVPDQDLSVDDVRAGLERSLAWHGNPRLAVGDVTETDENSITAEIVTKDGSLVQRFMVDRHTGAMRSAQ